jgi:predicted transcriptional regulator
MWLIDLAVLYRALVDVIQGTFVELDTNGQVTGAAIIDGRNTIYASSSDGNLYHFALDSAKVCRSAHSSVAKPCVMCQPPLSVFVLNRSV